MIHVIGDSHSWMFRGLGEVHHVGGTTMHHVGVQGIDLASCGVVEDDTLILVFGEIDCRCHLGRISTEAKVRLEHVVRPTVGLYCRVARDMINDHGVSRVLISCIVPPSSHGDAPSVPFYGSLADRVEVTMMVNRCLANECERRRLQFVDFYDSYALPDGSLDPAKSDGLVHVAEKCYGPVHDAVRNCLDINLGK